MKKVYDCSIPDVNQKYFNDIYRTGRIDICIKFEVSVSTTLLFA